MARKSVKKKGCSTVKSGKPIMAKKKPYGGKK